MAKENFYWKNPIVVIDYGVGNFLSITNTLTHLGYRFIVSNKAEDIQRASALILPGIGAFSEAMQNLKALNLISILEEEVLVNKKPILGICLGMQILAQSSEEGGFHEGLGWIPGKVIKFCDISDLKIPHVGWNDLDVIRRDPLFSLIEVDCPHFYFDHSFHFTCDDEFVSAKCNYGKEIPIAVQRENIFGVQFHPEKSQNDGLRLYRGFFNYVKKLYGDEE